MKVDKLANVLCKELKRLGFIVHMYKAYSTESVYIKLDYGVCNSIRISNHCGKKYLKYRYNIGNDVVCYEKRIDEFERYYYPSKDYLKLIEKIINDRDEKINKYGEYNYKKFMDRNKEDIPNQKGFWSQAIEVKL